MGSDPVGGISPTAAYERLVLSLDSEPADAVITIPAQVRSAAVRANSQVAPAIEFLDFAKDTAFLNSASQLVAVLTIEYPFTTSLVWRGKWTATPSPAMVVY